MTPETEAAIRQRTEAASDGPWTAEPGGQYSTGTRRMVRTGPYVSGPDGFAMFKGYFKVPVADAAFIAAARTDISVLLAEIDRLRAEMRDNLSDDGHDHVPILIDRPTRDRLRRYLMDDAPRGMGYTTFIEAALNTGASPATAEEETLIDRAEATAEMRWHDGDMDRWVTAQQHLNALRQLADDRVAEPAGLRWPTGEEAVQRLAVAMASEGFAVPASNRDEQWDAPYTEARNILARLAGQPSREGDAGPGAGGPG